MHLAGKNHVHEIDRQKGAEVEGDAGLVVPPPQPDRPAEAEFQARAREEGDIAVDLGTDGPQEQPERAEDEKGSVDRPRFD